MKSSEMKANDLQVVWVAVIGLLPFFWGRTSPQKTSGQGIYQSVLLSTADQCDKLSLTALATAPSHSITTRVFLCGLALSFSPPSPL